jgi:predicted Rossmann fold flavoprotein
VTDSWDIAIVGAGAAGLAAGIFAGEAKPGLRIALFDGAAKVGAKILVAGGGRCNVTHHAVAPQDYNAATRNVVKNVLSSFTVQDTVAWLGEMGVELKREPTGKLFPVTDKARTVLDALLGRLDEVGASLLTRHRVEAVTQVDDGFRIETSQGTHHARRVILCTGGRSLPKTGSDGGGYGVVEALGHTVTDQHPALVSMVLQQHFFHADLKGVSHDVEITTLADGKPVDRRTGSLLWTHFGLSGPVVMDASRHWLANRHAGRTVGWVVNLLPGERFETLEATFVAMAGRVPRLAVGKLLEQYAAEGPGRTELPARVSDVLLKHLGIDASLPLAQLRREDRRRLIHGLTALELPVEQERGWNHAEVTAGGVPMAEVAWRTMTSRRCEGLHLAGEILDVDGRIGGFNFQWAWATGYLAGRAAAASEGAARPDALSAVAGSNASA